MKCLIVFGTRPEAIKMAPLVQRLACNSHIDSRVCVTAQHREMLDQVLELFDIHPHYDLNLMESGQDLSDITARVIVNIKPVLVDFCPDVVFVHGDTTTSMAAALAAFYQQIPVHHVEAGLRTYKRYSPFPEELNRQLTSRLAAMHYAPTPLAAACLVKEGVSQDEIVVTGNTVIDALLGVVSKIKSDTEYANTLSSALAGQGYRVSGRRYIVITGHRRENFGQGFTNICIAVQRIALENPDIDIVYPVHLNPRVHVPVNQYLGDVSNVYLIPPLNYLHFTYLMMNSYLILTDSGGIQEEAPSLGKPVLVMRDTTERPEAVEAGTVLLVGTDEDMMVAEVTSLLRDTARYEAMANLDNPFGDGRAAEKIETLVMRFLT